MNAFPDHPSDRDDRRDGFAFAAVGLIWLILRLLLILLPLAFVANLIRLALS